jgi:hypothetical protein
VLKPYNDGVIPLDRENRDWRQRNMQRIDPEGVEPYPGDRAVAMNGVEDDAVGFDRWALRNRAGQTEPAA